MANERLRITRDKLAKIADNDHDVIKQLELLMDTVNSLRVVMLSVHGLVGETWEEMVERLSP